MSINKWLFCKKYLFVLILTFSSVRLLAIDILAKTSKTFGADLVFLRTAHAEYVPAT